MLYSYKNQYPSPLPHRIVLSNGFSRTDNTTFTSEEILDAGYVAIDNPPTVEYPNRLDWNGTGWVIREPNEIEILQQVQQVQGECKSRLFETDYKVIKAVEQGVAVEPHVVAYRQQLRDLYNSVATSDMWNVTWPVLEQPVQIADESDNDNLSNQ
jgi:hypothetical protein